ncbi:MAG: glycosyltransferase [Planctomycetota bacterium]|jgi:glycosyltransferase involved in cell wall biosynthesis/peptidoglycan/xylan/chitin deacetylase (PgdA/CDA1 family)
MNKTDKLLIMHVIGSLGPGGAERQLITIVRHQAEKHSVMVCCLNEEGELSGELKQENIPVFCLYKKPGIDLSAVSRLTRLLKSNNIDLVHSHIWSSNLWARVAAVFAGVKYRVIHEHSMFSVERFHRRAVDYILSCFTDAVICVSSQILRQTVSQSRVSESKVVLLRNGINLDRFCGFPARREKKLQDRLDNGLKDRVVIVGSLEPRKDHITFIKSACRIIEEGLAVEFQIIGDGPLRQDLEALVSNLGMQENIKFAGNTDNVNDFLAEAAIYVSSSVTEGISIAMLEALAAGVPVVATAVGGNVEIAGAGKNILLVPPEDAAALADGIKALLDCRGVGPVLAERARKLVRERFDQKIMNYRIDQLYQHIMVRHDTFFRGGIKRLPRWALSRIPAFLRVISPLKLMPGEIRILTYHRVRECDIEDRLSVSTTEFTRQLSFIERTGIPIYNLTAALRLQEDGNLPNGAFVVTFDDGYSDMLTDALPVLNEFNAVGTLYLPAKLIESNGMIERYKDDNSSRLLSWKECAKLADSGWEIGSHSMTHPALPDLSDDQLLYEINESKILIEQQLEVKVNSFAFPSGKLSRESFAVLRESGYTSAVTVWPGSNTSEADRFVLSRTEISGDDTFADFVVKLKGGFDFYQRIRSAGSCCDPEILV